MSQVLSITKKKDEKFLRRKMADFDFTKFTAKEVRELVKRMRTAMEEANGVGLAANQIGLDMRVFVAQVERKFYAVFNPEITSVSKELELSLEGCLSVPEIMGEVPRHYRVTLEGYDKSGKKITIRAWGLLARVLQHEVDHLNGMLFIDHIKKKK